MTFTTWASGVKRILRHITVIATRQCEKVERCPKISACMHDLRVACLLMVIWRNSCAVHIIDETPAP